MCSWNWALMISCLAVPCSMEFMNRDHVWFSIGSHPACLVPDESFPCRKSKCKIWLPTEHLKKFIRHMYSETLFDKLCFHWPAKQSPLIMSHTLQDIFCNSNGLILLDPDLTMCSLPWLNPEVSTATSFSFAHLYLKQGAVLIGWSFFPPCGSCALSRLSRILCFKQVCDICSWSSISLVSPGE